MPTYEYRCEACGHRWEAFQRMSDDPLEECPECGEGSAERLISPGGGLVFKGSGFYATDYRDPPSGGAEGGTESDSDSGTKGEGGPDSAAGGDETGEDARSDG